MIVRHRPPNGPGEMLRGISLVGACVGFALSLGMAAPALAATPVLSALAPGSGTPGTTITASGSGFGTPAGSVSLAPSGGGPATVVSSTYWSDTQVSAILPWLPAGTVSVSVYSPASGASNTLPFTVTTQGSPPVTGGLTLDYDAADADGQGHAGSGQSPNPIVDLSGSGNDGVFQGYADNAGGIYAGGGGAPDAFVFDGGDDAISTSTPVNSYPALSLDVWFRTSSTSGAVLLSWNGTPVGSSGQSTNALYLSDAGQLIFAVCCTDIGHRVTLGAPGDYADGQWHEVIATLGVSNGSDDLQLYVDGSLAASSGPLGIDEGTGSRAFWRIGNGGVSDTYDFPNPPTAQSLAGAIASVRIYSQALTGAEAHQNFEAGPNAIAAPLSVRGVGSAAATAGVAYEFHMDAIGGTPPYTWVVSSGALPVGLTLDPATGVISGRPQTAGRSTFTVQAADSAGATATSPQAILVRAPPRAVAPPTISAIQPDGAVAGGGTSVTITGTGFAPDATVRFGSEPAADVTVSGDGTTIAAVAPPGSGNVLVTVSNPAAPAALGATGYNAYALMSDGSVLSWGAAGAALGNGYEDVPVQVPGVTDVTQVAGGYAFAVALRGDGTVWAWGDDNADQLGQGSNGPSSSYVPLQVQGLTGVVQVAAGHNFALALRSDGTVWEWGASYAGLDNVAPAEVPGLTGVTAIAASADGATAYAVTGNGTLWAWGRNASGQLGDGSTSDSATPVQVHGLEHVTAAAAGPDDGYAVLANGSLWAWGADQYGQLGSGATASTPSEVPVQVAGLSGVRSIAAGSGSGYCQADDAFALTSDGRVWEWGAVSAFASPSSADYCPLTAVNTPQQVSGLPTDVRALATGSADGVAYAMGSDGSVWAWGVIWFGNSSGELGNGTTTPSVRPVRVELPDAVDIGAGLDAALAVRGDGTVWAWGGFDDRLDLGPVGETAVSPVRVGGLSGATSIGAGGGVSGGTLGLAIGPGGAPWGWGCGGGSCSPAAKDIAGAAVPVVTALDPYGGAVVRFDGTVWQFTQAGQPLSAPATPLGTEVPFPPGVVLTQVVTVQPGDAASFALDNQGRVWVWAHPGSSLGGMTPNLVPGLTDVVAIDGNNGCSGCSAPAGGPALYALRADGTVWAAAVVGGADGTAAPAVVAGLPAVQALAAGSQGSEYALAADGTVWAWGSNSWGQLGVGKSGAQLSSSASPLQVVSLTGATAVAAGSGTAFALTSDGAVWAWGGDVSGGVPSVPGRASVAPVQVPGFDLSSLSAWTGFTYVAPGGVPPAVTGIQPTSGPSAGGTIVRVTGSGFTVATAVYFGGTPAQSFTVQSDAVLTAVSPPGSGTVDVTIASIDGPSASVAADRYSYEAAAAAPVVTLVQPSSGPAAGGTSVTVTGSGFTGATLVRFGATDAVRFNVESGTMLTAVSPPGSGTVDVTVVTAAGTSAVSGADRFAYTSPSGLPAALSFSVQPPGWVPLATGGATGAPFTVAVALDDQAGQVSVGATDTIVLTLLAPGGGPPVYSATATAAAGVATFSVGPLAATVARPGSGYVLDALDTSDPRLSPASSHPFALVYPWLLFTSQPSPSAVPFWQAVLPASGQGDDSGIIQHPFTFAGVQFTLPYTSGAPLVLAGDQAGEAPFCVDGTWDIEISDGGTTTTRTGSGCTGPLDLSALGLPSGPLGVQIQLTSPTSGTAYGVGSMYLLAVGGVANPWMMQLSDALRPIQLNTAQQAAIAAGQRADVPVVVGYTPLPVAGIHSEASWDPAALSVTAVPVAGGSGHEGGQIAPGHTGLIMYPAGNGATSGQDAFQLEVTCVAPGTWPVSLAGTWWSHGPLQSLSATLSVKCAAPVAGPAAASGVAVDPTDGALQVAITGSGLDGADRAVLVDSNGAVVGSSASLSNRSATALTARFPTTPAGLYALRVLDGSGRTIADTGTPSLAVPPAMPFFSLDRVDQLPQVPGFTVTHLWHLANLGTTDGVALALFEFPRYLPKPVLQTSLLPSGTRLIAEEQLTTDWAAYVAIPVGAGQAVDVGWAVQLPPAAVGVSATADWSTGIDVGQMLPIFGQVLGGVSAFDWPGVQQRSGDLVWNMAQQGAEDFANVQDAVAAMSQTAVDLYLQQLSEQFPALAAGTVANGLSVVTAALDQKLKQAGVQQQEPFVSTGGNGGTSAVSVSNNPCPPGEPPTVTPIAGPLPSSSSTAPVDHGFVGDFLADTWQNLRDPKMLASQGLAASNVWLNYFTFNGFDVVGGGNVLKKLAPDQTLFVESKYDATTAVAVASPFLGNVGGVTETTAAVANISEDASGAVAATVEPEVLDSASASGLSPAAEPGVSGYTSLSGDNEVSTMEYSSGGRVQKYYVARLQNLVPDSQDYYQLAQAYRSDASVVPEVQAGESVPGEVEPADTFVSAYIRTLNNPYAKAARVTGTVTKQVVSYLGAEAYSPGGGARGSCVRASYDPNELVTTPAGAGSSGWVVTPPTLTYLVRFQNSPTATAPAQNVRVVLHLDANLDPATVQGGDASFAGTQFAFDPTSGTVTWNLPGVDLPPDTTPPNGEAWVSFTVSPKPGLPTGTAIRESAQVFFDYNPPVSTPSVVRTIDATPPSVTLGALPLTEPAGPVTVSWSGYSQAGVASYTLYSSQDGGPLLPVDSTTATSATIQAAAGHTYGVAVQAFDEAGLASPTPVLAQTSFTVPGSSASGAPVVPPPVSQPGTVGFTATGGTFATADGTMVLSVPAGALGGSDTLTMGESCAAPSGIPADTRAASCLYLLTGSPLTTPARATIRYRTSVLGVLAPQRLAVYRQGADGSWTFVPTAVNAGAGTVAAKVSGPGSLVVLAGTRSFTDVPTTYWAAPEIDAAVAASVVAGYPDGTFRPDAPVSRAEFAKMLALALNLSVPPSGAAAPARFTDVPATAWFAPYVTACVQAGLIRGTSPTTFAPDSAVTREEMAVLLSRALTLQAGTAPAFRDAASIDPWAVGGVAAAASAGLVDGFPDGTFRPTRPLTRAQAAKVLALVWQREAS